MKQQLTFKASELPKDIVIIGEQGEQRYYTLRRAGRKFGALLCATESPGSPNPPNQGGHKPAA